MDEHTVHSPCEIANLPTTSGEIVSRCSYLETLLQNSFRNTKIFFNFTPILTMKVRNKFPKLLIQIIIITLPFFQFLIAQSLVEDTVVVAFKKRDVPKNSIISVDRILDNRDENPKIVGSYEISKYIFIPVDLLIITDEPLCKEIKNLLPDATQLDSIYLDLTIEKFNLNKIENSLIFSHYQLAAVFNIFSGFKGEEKIHYDQKFYDTKVKKPLLRDNLKNGFEKVVWKWEEEFLNDIAKISYEVISNRRENSVGYMRKPDKGKYVNMHSGLDFIYKSDGYSVDGEIFFSNIESNRRFFRCGYGIRFSNSKRFDSIILGRPVDYLFWRLSRNIVLRLKSQFGIGVNRWKDWQEFNHKFIDAFIIDYSLSEGIIYNPIDGRSLLLGFGIEENIYYIYSTGIRFSPGILFYLRIKL